MPPFPWAIPPPIPPNNYVEQGPEEVDARFDRLALVAQLLSRCVDPKAAMKLAQFTLPGGRIKQLARFQQHLEPFRHPDLSVALLEHLRACGVVSPQLDALLEVLQPVASLPTRSPLA
jgi:hypothetical protein